MRGSCEREAGWSCAHRVRSLPATPRSTPGRAPALGFVTRSLRKPPVKVAFQVPMASGRSRRCIAVRSTSSTCSLPHAHISSTPMRSRSRHLQTRRFDRSFLTSSLGATRTSRSALTRPLGIHSASFGSIFNFDRGILNAHTDRGVLTAIYGRHRISSDSGKSDGGNQTSDRLRADSDQLLDGQVWDSTGGNQTTSLDHLRAAADPLLDGQLWDRTEALSAPCGGDITDGRRVRLWGLDPQTAAWHPLDTDVDNTDGISMGDPMIDDPNHRWDPLKEPIARDARHPPLDTSGAHSDGGGADGGGTPFVLLVAGEQLERLSGGGYRALLHACRVDPRSEPISMLHQGPHPGSEREGNRQSMALVLALDEDSKGRPVLSHRR